MYRYGLWSGLEPVYTVYGYWYFHGCQSLLNLADTVPSTVASPGFVARRGKVGKYVMGQSRRTSRPGAAVAR